MWDQFIAGLTSETLRVKLTGKGHIHRDAAAIPVLVNIIALRLVRDAISVESLVISLVHVKEEQESKQATSNSQISLMMMQMRRRL